MTLKAETESKVQDSEWVGYVQAVKKNAKKLNSTPNQMISDVDKRMKTEIKSVQNQVSSLDNKIDAMKNDIDSKIDMLIEMMKNKNDQ